MEAEELINERERIAHAFKRVFDPKSEDGQIVLQEINRLALQGEQAYTPEMPTEHTIFRNGCQQVGIDINNWINYDLSTIEKQGEETYGVLD